MIFKLCSRTAICHSLIIAMLCLFGASCNVINPSEPVPTFIHIDSFHFTGNTQLTGTNSHKITVAYVYLDNQPVGVFNLPVTFPVIMDAPGTLQVVPGVDYDGLTGQELLYPFYQADTFHVVPQPGKVINHTPLTYYTSITQFPKIENFESFSPPSTPFLSASGINQIITTSDPGKVFEGQRAGYLHLANGGDTVTNQLKDPFALPTNSDSYLEFDYRSTMYTQVGLTTIENSTGDTYFEYLIGLNPRNTWGKVYIGLRSIAAGHTGNTYNLLIRSQVADGQTGGGDLNIDNIKVVTF